MARVTILFEEPPMSTSYLRLTKSESRVIAEHELRNAGTSYGGLTEWRMSNGVFFTAFVVIAALVTLLALILR
jgi:hypothetical protein